MCVTISIELCKQSSPYICMGFCIKIHIWHYVRYIYSPLDCKEIQPIHPKGDQSWVFIGRNDAEAETPILWPLHVKS